MVGSVAEVLAVPEVTCLLIASPNFLHLEQLEEIALRHAAEVELAPRVVCIPIRHRVGEHRVGFRQIQHTLVVGQQDEQVPLVATEILERLGDILG